MAETAIEWADRVWNFVRGCRRVSPGCGGAAGVGGCYAERQAIRFANPGGPYEGLVQLSKQGPRWTGEGRFVPEKLAEPLSWRPRKDGRRERVFVNSMSDLFFEEFSDEQIAASFAVMAACPHVDFLILTKRAERMKRWFADYERSAKAVQVVRGRSMLELAGRVATARSIFSTAAVARIHAASLTAAWPLPNVHLGVSAEDQQRADERIPLLLQTPAAVRWVSAEPLLGPIDFEGFIWPACIATREEHVREHDGGLWCDERSIDWLVVGGESGPGARECSIEWLRSIVAQCKSASVPIFVKQLGATIRVPESEQIGDVTTGWSPFARVCESDDWLIRLPSNKGGAIEEWPHDLRVREFPEARA